MPALKNFKSDLKRIYKRSFEISLISSLSIIIAAFKFSPYSSTSDDIKITPQDIIKIEEIISTVQKPNIPEPPKIPQLIEASTADLSDDLILPDIEDHTPVKLPDASPPSHNIVLDDEEFIHYPEDLPSPIGGLQSIQEKVHYTEIAKRIGLEGTVYIEARIDKNGNVVDAVIKKGLGGGLNEEALNAVKSTKFNPGKQRGKAVNVKMVIPIKFILK
jgi:protein TonB